MEEILDEVTHSVNVFYDFEAGADDELSLSAGDMVKVISTVGDEWIKGLNSFVSLSCAFYLIRIAKLGLGLRLYPIYWLNMFDSEIYNVTLVT